MDPHSFKISTIEWVHLEHVSVMKCHIFYFTPTADSVKLYMITLSIFQCRDWPVYEVAASESESYMYFMASIFPFLVGVLLHVQYGLCKGNDYFRIERCKSSWTNALS